MLHKLQEDLIISSMPIKSSSARTAIWEAYHQLCSSALVEVWTKCYEDMQIEDYDVMVSQMTNDQLFNDLLKFHCPTDTQSETIIKKALSTLEETIIRYASGYV